MNKKEQKLCFIDLETTGTDENIHHIWQLALRITDEKLNTIDSLELKWRPISLDGVTEEALGKTRMTREQLESFPLSAKEAYDLLIAFLAKHVAKYDKTDKLVFVAYNAQFDARFLRKFFEHNNDVYFGSQFWYPELCVAQACMFMFHSIRFTLPNFKLETLCTQTGLGWDEGQAHDAQYDIDKTLQLYKYLIDPT